MFSNEISHQLCKQCEKKWPVNSGKKCLKVFERTGRGIGRHSYINWNCKSILETNVNMKLKFRMFRRSIRGHNCQRKTELSQKLNLSQVKRNWKCLYGQNYNHFDFLPLRIWYFYCIFFWFIQNLLAFQ